MDNKDEWKELEQWEENRKIENKEKFGLDFNKINIKKKEKHMNIFAKVLNTIGRTGIVVFTLISLLLAFSVFMIINVNFSNIKTRANIDVEFVLDKYHIKAKIIEKEIDQHENGKYIFELRNNKEIKFVAIKKWGALSEDFEANYQKYIFDSWDADIKTNFKIKENIDENGLLNYENFIVIENEEELSKATEYLIAFLEYSEKWNKENKIVEIQWKKAGQFIVPIKVYIEMQEKIIYPYNTMYQTADEIRNEVQRRYKQ